MARSWLFVCLWAVVLLVFVEQCHAGDADGAREEPKCTEQQQRKCAETGQTCNETTGNCECQKPKKMIGDQCKEEPKCTEEQQRKCAETGQTCDETTGNCECKKPKKMIGDQCKEPKCKEEQQRKCAETGQTCDETTGNCECKKPKKMIGDQCKEESKCTEEQQRKCAETGQTCDETTGNCECKKPKKMIGDQCKDSCQEKLQECQNGKKTSCKIINGTAECVCPTSMKENKDGDCFLAKKVTVTFQLKPGKKRSATYSEEPTCNENITELIKVIMQQVPNVIEESIVCNGNDVSFDVFAENEAEEKKIKDEISRNCQGDDCNLGAGIRFEGKSATLTATDMCKEEETQKLAEKMGMICVYNKTTQMLCNTNKTMAIGKADLQGIPFEVCNALPCDLTCKDDKMHCVLESCVCKPQYKLENGECKSVCELKPSVCPSGATCVPGKGDQSFYCECPPKLTGPLCQRENKPLQTAKLNIVVVGVVLASLLLLCFVVSASIISRLRKKAQGPSFSKDCERRPQRELRGYDGPYKASDPASLHRGRDHTSL